MSRRVFKSQITVGRWKNKRCKNSGRTGDKSSDVESRRAQICLPHYWLVVEGFLSKIAKKNGQGKATPLLIMLVLEWFFIFTDWFMIVLVCLCKRLWYQFIKRKWWKRARCSWSINRIAIFFNIDQIIFRWDVILNTTPQRWSHLNSVKKQLTLNKIWSHSISTSWQAPKYFVSLLITDFNSMTKNGIGNTILRARINFYDT